MSLKLHTKRLLWLIIAPISIIGAVVVANTIHKGQKCKKVNVEIVGAGEHRLLKAAEILGVINADPLEAPQGKLFEKIDFRAIEKKILAKKKLVKSCQVHRDLSGELTVSIQEHTPIARVLNANATNHQLYDNYLAEDGSFIGMSQHYTPRVILLSGAYLTGKKSLQSPPSKPILDLISYIKEDEFWRAQITQIIVEKDGGIRLLPEVGTHVIEFGLAKDFDTKFKKLKLLYNYILPAKGWDKYKHINIKYRNQIVCE